MHPIHIITPVKDSIESTLQTIDTIMNSKVDVPFHYTVYNDFSSPENTDLLEEASRNYGFELVNLKDVTDHPSPNYLLILQTAQEKALKEKSILCIVESDVLLRPDTIQSLYHESLKKADCGLLAAVTVDTEEKVNYPYLYARNYPESVIKTQKHLSFCCTILSNKFLNAFDFHQLDPSKSWHDVTISHTSLKLGFSNYLCMGTTVYHKPHSSRPWKLLKYSNPIKYYFLKIINKRDKI